MDRLIRIGSLYKELGQFDIAVSHFKEILAKADPAEQIEIQYQIGDCFYQMERFTIAIAEYMKILEYGDPASVKLPFHTNARWYIALSFESIGQYDNAINYLDKIIARYSSADPFHRKAMREKEKIENIMKKR